MIRRPPRSTLFPTRRSSDLAPRDAGTQLTRDEIRRAAQKALEKCSRENSKWTRADLIANLGRVMPRCPAEPDGQTALDRKSTRLNSSHGYISYAVFCLKKKI